MENKRYPLPRVLVVFLCLTLFVLVTGGAALASDDEVRIRVDGVFIEMQYGQAPVIIDGRTLVPVRDVMSALGFAVDWDPYTNAALLDKPGVSVVIPIGGDTMFVNDAAFALDVPAQTMNRPHHGARPRDL